MKRPNSTEISSIRQIATFRLGDHSFGIDIRWVQEINRNPRISRVPHTHNHVQGVINLRGEVTTLIDLATVLRIEARNDHSRRHSLILREGDDLVGVLVDSVDDILTIGDLGLSQLPSTLTLPDRNLCLGLHRTDSKIIIVLDVEQTLSIPV